MTAAPEAGWAVPVARVMTAVTQRIVGGARVRRTPVQVHSDADHPGRPGWTALSEDPQRRRVGSSAVTVVYLQHCLNPRNLPKSGPTLS